MIKRHYVLGILALSSFPFITSCDKDDEDPKAGITFEVASITEKESDGTLESFHPSNIQGATGRLIDVRLVLNRPAAQAAVVAFSTEGSATINSVTAQGDYAIEGGTNITIEKGATEVLLPIRIFEDFEYEAEDVNEDEIPYENVVITLTSVISGPVSIGEQNAITIEILEDDLLVDLTWNSNQATQAGDVDMDLSAWILEEGEWSPINYSANPGPTFESLHIPAGFPDATYGLAYTYYAGTSNDVDFTVDVTNHGGTLNGSAAPLQFQGNRTLDNLNEWDSETNDGYKGDPVIVQTLSKSQFNYQNVSSLGNPGAGAGSRSSLKMPTINRTAPGINYLKGFISK